MTDVDPLDVGMVLAVPAVFGIVASEFYTPAVVLVLPLLAGFVAFLLWAYYTALGNVWGDLRD